MSGGLREPRQSLEINSPPLWVRTRAGELYMEYAAADRSPIGGWGRGLDPRVSGLSHDTYDRIIILMGSQNAHKSLILFISCFC